MDWLHTRPSPHGNALANHTAIAAPAAHATSLRRRRDHTHHAIAMSAGNISGFVASAQPASTPHNTTHPRCGVSRNWSAAHTAQIVNAAASPSALTGPVVHRMEPVVAASSAAMSEGAGVLPKRRAAAHTPTATAIPERNGA